MFFFIYPHVDDFNDVWWYFNKLLICKKIINLCWLKLPLFKILLLYLYYHLNSLSMYYNISCLIHQADLVVDFSKNQVNFCLKNYKLVSFMIICNSISLYALKVDDLLYYCQLVILTYYLELLTLHKSVLM